jgi:D-alanyl-lipoteichoic acid acyltransferase DltB (MBOAT superfamily)
MPFNSLDYVLFLPVVYVLFYVTVQRWRWAILLAGSLLFYAALGSLHLLGVLLLVTLTTYGFGLGLAAAGSARTKRVLLWSGIAANLLILAVMKYLPVLAEGLAALSTVLTLDARVPPLTAFTAIGVSYYVFQAMSYLFDLDLEVVKPERHLGYFALYLAFFPKLLQGPIERAAELLPQLRATYELNYDNLRFGLLLFTWGLFKKVVLADRLGLYVETVYGDVHAFRGLALLLATYAYAFQVYMDFSGYTDMALGSARLFSIRLTPNFSNPYAATSVADFWRRWHISFSRWILDYIFKPLQMRWREARTWGTVAALLVTFLISGVWHGARWGFLVWGGLHGLYMAIAIVYKPYQKRLHRALGVEKTRLLRIWQIVVTFHLVCLAWVFFRAATLADALYIIANLGRGAAGVRTQFLLSQGKLEFRLIVVAALLALAVHVSAERLRGLFLRSVSCRWLLYYALVLAIIVLGVRTKSPFVYFGF